MLFIHQSISAVVHQSILVSVRYVVFFAAIVLAACSPPPGHVRVKLSHPQRVSLGVFDQDGKLVAQPLIAMPLAAGTHEIDCRSPELKAGSWTWRAVAFDEPSLEPIVTLGADLPEGGDAGPPCAVASDTNAVFLGWREARNGHEIVACEPSGRVLWTHHHGPGASGVRALATDGGVVFVLADADGTKLYRLDAKTGEPLPWEGRPERDLVLTSLWGSDPKAKPDRAGYLSAAHDRLYLTFGEEQFTAVLDAKTGAYVITITGPQLGSMAFSTTPMKDPQTGEEKVIDFGVASIAGNGLAYFLMEHEPAWVMASVTRWLQGDERVCALALVGDAMKTSVLTIYTALGVPHHQVQVRLADTVEGFEITVGKNGGRVPTGPWEPEALENIHALTVDATGQIWIAEGDEHFGRFTVWKTNGKQGELVRQIFGPLDGTTLTVDPSDPFSVSLGGLRYHVDPATHTATVIEKPAQSLAPSPANGEWRESGGLLLWAAPENERTAWSVHRTGDRLVTWKRGVGASVSILHGPDSPITAGTGQVTFSAH
jgi:hypothetical protein